MARVGKRSSPGNPAKGGPLVGSGEAHPRPTRGTRPKSCLGRAHGENRRTSRPSSPSRRMRRIGRASPVPSGSPVPGPTSRDAAGSLVRTAVGRDSSSGPRHSALRGSSGAPNAFSTFPVAGRARKPESGGARSSAAFPRSRRRAHWPRSGGARSSSFPGHARPSTQAEVRWRTVIAAAFPGHADAHLARVRWLTCWRCCGAGRPGRAAPPSAAHRRTFSVMRADSGGAIAWVLPMCGVITQLGRDHSGWPSGQRLRIGHVEPRPADRAGPQRVDQVVGDDVPAAGHVDQPGVGLPCRRARPVR